MALRTLHNAVMLLLLAMWTAAVAACMYARCHPGQVAATHRVWRRRLQVLSTAVVKFTCKDILQQVAAWKRAYAMS
jgi:hypothetical protein